MSKSKNIKYVPQLQNTVEIYDYTAQEQFDTEKKPHVRISIDDWNKIEKLLKEKGDV